MKKLKKKELIGEIAVQMKRHATAVSYSEHWRGVANARYSAMTRSKARAVKSFRQLQRYQILLAGRANTIKRLLRELKAEKMKHRETIDRLSRQVGINKDLITISRQDDAKLDELTQERDTLTYLRNTGVKQRILWALRGRRNRYNLKIEWEPCVSPKDGRKAYKISKINIDEYRRLPFLTEHPHTLEGAGLIVTDNAVILCRPKQWRLDPLSDQIEFSVGRTYSRGRAKAYARVLNKRIRRAMRTYRKVN